MRPHRREDLEPIEFDPMLQQAMKRMLPGITSWAPVGDRPFLAIGTRDERDLRIRRWPDGTSPERVRFVHRLQDQLRGEAPILCARPISDTAISESWLVVEGKLIDVQEWLPGRAAIGRAKAQEQDGHTVHRPVALDDSHYAMLIGRVATGHRRSEALATSRHAPLAPVEHVLRAIDQSWGAARVRLRPSAPTTPPIQRWLRLGEQALPAALDAIRAMDQQGLRMVIAHLSLWPAHVLVDREDNVALLDFGAAVSTTPLLDVAQLITRFAGWTGDNAELVLGHYAGVRPLSPQERRALPSFAALDLILEAARLLRLGYGGVVQPSSREAVSARLGAQDMLNSLEAVLPTVVRGDGPVPFVKRQKLAAIKRSAGGGPVKPSPAKKTGGPRRRKR